MVRFSPRARVATCALALMGLTASGRQAKAQAVRPAPPPSVPTLDAGSLGDDAAGFAAWRDSASLVDTVGWVRVLSPRYVVVIRPPLSRRDSAMRALLRDALEACRETMGLSSAQVDSLVETRPFAPFDSAVADHPLLEVTVLPRDPAPNNCSTSDERESVEISLLAEGFRATNAALVSPTSSVDAVSLQVGASPRALPLVGRVAPVRIARDGGPRRDVLTAVRFYVPIDAFAPADGGDSDVTLLVWNDQRIAAESIAVARPEVERLIRTMLPWRTAALRDAALPGMPIALPVPRDSVLRAAHGASLSGAHRTATTAALRRIFASGLRDEDRFLGRLQVGLTFAAAGDSALGRWFVRAALDSEPCAELSPDVTVPLRHFVDDVRPTARCTPIAASTILRSAWYPGRAQRIISPDRPDAGRVPAALAAATAIASVVLHVNANRKYSEYEREMLDPQAKFIAARDAHITANFVGAATYAIWGGSILHAIWSEHRLARRAAAVRGLGARAGGIDPAPQGLGLALRFF